MTSLACLSKFRLGAVALAVLLGVFTPRVRAHPHVWIAYSVTAQMRGETCFALEETWTFSRGFPFSLIGDVSDMPKSGPLNAGYTAMFREQAFSSLKGADYFTHVFVGGKSVGLANARDFRVAIENGHIVYRFVVPLATPTDVKRATVQVGVWDDTFFVDFESAGEHPLGFDASAPKNCRAQNFEDRDHPIFGGTVLPISTKLSC